jgi:TatD DNase family protein
MTQLLDSHAHLDVEEFDADRDEVIARAREAGLNYLLLIADLTKPESLERVRDLSQRHEEIYWAAGADPHQSAHAQDNHFEALRMLAQHPKFLAVGEIGLDYFYDYPRDVQTRVFLKQAEIARELRRPIIIHCRDAWSDLRLILHERAAHGAAANERAGASRAGILHCFTGSAGDATDLIGLGFYVSFAGNVTYKKSGDLREVARALPADRLLTETDSPYLAPLEHRGHRNEPAFVRETTRQLATQRGWDEETMGRQVVENFARLFELPLRAA